MFPGAIPEEAHTPRIYTYGGTGDYDAVVKYIIHYYPNMRLFGIGFSLGANQVIKYLGENPSRQKYFLGYQSWCQGYDPNLCITHLRSMKRGARFFNYLISRKQKGVLINRHLDILLGHRNRVSTYANDNQDEPESAAIHNEDVIDNRSIIPSHILLDSSSTQPALMEDVITHDHYGAREHIIPDWAPAYAHVTTGRPPDFKYPERDINGFLYRGWDNITPINREEVS